MREQEERGLRYIADGIHLGKCGLNAVGRKVAENPRGSNKDYVWKMSLLTPADDSGGFKLPVVVSISC